MPVVGPVTARLYTGLPEVYRDADAAQDAGASNYPLLRFLALLGDQLTPLDQLLARLEHVPLDERGTQPTSNAFGVAEPWQRFGDGLLGDGTFGDADTSDLVDPASADAGWLPWLAQLLGVNITGLTVPEARAALINPADSWARGTPDAIRREARRELGAGAYVDVLPHFGGDPFTIAIVTKRAETYGATSWGELKAQAPTWGALKALGSWRAAEAASVVLATQAERPAGYRLTHRYLEDL